VATEIVIEWPEGPKRYAMPTAFTYREMGRIKTLTSIRAGEIEDALLAGDTDLIIAIAQLSAERAGDSAPIQALEDLEFGAIRVEADQDEDPTKAAEAADEDATPAEETPMTPEAGGTPA
jgi:hypothetical protein